MANGKWCRIGKGCVARLRCREVVDMIVYRLLAEHGIARWHPASFEIVLISRQRRCIAREDIRVQTRERVGLTAALHKGEVGGEKVGALAKKAVERSCRLKLGEIGLKQRDIGRLIARRELPRGEIGEIAVELRCISLKDIGRSEERRVGQQGDIKCKTRWQ